jgi:hypothetical protein
MRQRSTYAIGGTPSTCVKREAKAGHFEDVNDRVIAAVKPIASHRNPNGFLSRGCAALI